MPLVRTVVSERMGRRAHLPHLQINRGLAPGLAPAMVAKASATVRPDTEAVALRAGPDCAKRLMRARFACRTIGSRATHRIIRR